MEMTVKEREAMLDKEVSAIELRAQSLVVETSEDYAVAGNLARDVKTAQKKVDEYWEPMRKSTYEAYKSVTDHKKEMTDPLKNAETILKKKMSAYKVEEERKRREEEERLRRIAQEEAQKKLQEAIDAEAAGDADAMEYAMAEAEAYDSQMTFVQAPKTKVDGVSQRKTWEIKSIDLSKLPCEMGGVVLRPADEQAIMGLIRTSKGHVEIPGVQYEEKYTMVIKAS